MENTYVLMRKFYELQAADVRLIDFLMSKNGKFVGNMSELAREMSVDVNDSNKIVRRLHKANIIEVQYKDKPNAKMKTTCGCVLPEDWMDRLLIADIPERASAKCVNYYANKPKKGRLIYGL